MLVVALVDDLMDRSRLTAAVPDVTYTRDPAAAAGADVVVVDLARHGSARRHGASGRARRRASSRSGRTSTTPRLDRARADGADVVVARSVFFRDPGGAWCSVDRRTVGQNERPDGHRRRRPRARTGTGTASGRARPARLARAVGIAGQGPRQGLPGAAGAHLRAAPPGVVRAGVQLRRDVPRHPGQGDRGRRAALRGRRRPEAAARPLRVRRDVRVLRHDRAVVGADRRDGRGGAHRAPALRRGPAALRHARGMDRRACSSCARWSRSRRRTARPRTSRCSCCRS